MQLFLRHKTFKSFCPLLINQTHLKLFLQTMQSQFELILRYFQGMLIAVFYCFLNGEVQGEVTKFWKNFRLKNGLPSHTFRKSSTYHTNGTQITALASTNSADDRSHGMQETSLLSPNGEPNRSGSISSELLIPPQRTFGQRTLNDGSRLKEDVV